MEITRHYDIFRYLVKTKLDKIAIAIEGRRIPIDRTIQKLLSSQYPKYKEQYKQPLRVHKAIEPQIRCRTKAQGTTHYQCPNDQSQKHIYHSCRQSGCTICGYRRQHQWLEKQKERLLNCDHYHLVFTLPSEYRQLWLYNRKWFIQTHFEVVRETLKTLLETSKDKSQKTYLGATPGFMLVLHTWGRQLNHHPHIHCLITAGGLDRKQQWKALENDFLVPIRVLKALYRGKFQSKIKTLIKSREVHMPRGTSRSNLLRIHKTLYKKEWSVRIQEKYDHGKGVLIYLSRYLGSRPIKPKQIVSMTNKEVTFGYKDHRDGKNKRLRLHMKEFMRRLLMHQAEIGVHKIRYYGIYASQAKKKKKICDAQLGKQHQGTESENALDRISKIYEVFCEHCGAVMEPAYVSFKNWIEKPINKETSYLNPAIIVQQGAEPDACRSVPP